MTEWAQRIQASIESMNRLVDGFQLAGTSNAAGGNAGNAGSTDRAAAAGTVTTPASSSSPSSSSSPAAALSGSDGTGSNVKGRGAGAWASAHGVESFATAQLGFRRGLEGLLADRAGGGGGSGTALLPWRSPSTILPGTGAVGPLSSGSSGTSGGGSGSGLGVAFESASAGALLPDRSEERSVERESTGWEETKGGGGGGGVGGGEARRRAWENGRDEDRSQSMSSSSLAGEDVVSAGGGRGSTGGRGGGPEASLTSLSSSSFGPDLEAEIASLEALAESLQQRKMRFEPKVSAVSVWFGRRFVSHVLAGKIFMATFSDGDNAVFA